MNQLKFLFDFIVSIVKAFLANKKQSTPTIEQKEVQVEITPEETVTIEVPVEPLKEPRAKLFKSVEEAEARYGKVINNIWSKEQEFMTLYKVPSFCSNWVNTASGKPVNKIYINKDCVAPLEEALTNLNNRGLISELKTFDGCFNIRDVRGIPGKLSTHAYGLAIDLNAAENPLKKEPVLSAEFVKCFTDAGWTWGGNFARKDGMHFEYAWN